MWKYRKTDVKEDSAAVATTTAAVSAADAGGVVEDLSPPSHPSLYEAGEVVLVSHSGEFYEAKVEKVEFDTSWRYFVHYRGWKRRWDEWVRVDRLMKHTEENVQKVSWDNKQITDVDGKMQENNSSLIYHKRKREHIMVKGKGSALVEKLVNISIPPTLRKQLMDDFEFINQMGKLVKLPRSPNVDDLIEKYRDYRGKKDDVMSTSGGEVLSGLCAYFNRALPVILLYNKERQQYQEAIVDEVQPSAVYGAEHLLRLFVKLPVLLYDLNIEEETLRELHQNLYDFLKFLQKNQSVFFLSSYHVPEASGRSTNKDGD